MVLKLVSYIPIRPMDAQAMQLKTGDRLWLGGKGASALLMVE
ncbi:hypothetical protein ACFMPD_02660 [Sedimentitalea sp. HM32M-2]